MTDTSYLYKYFAEKSSENNTKESAEEKRGDIKQDKRNKEHTEDKKHV